MTTSTVQRVPLFNRSRWARFAAVAGPGMIVMLADTGGQRDHCSAERRAVGL